MRIPLLVLASSLVLSGCAIHSVQRCPAPTCRMTTPRPTPRPTPRLIDRPYKLYDGETGRETTLDAFVQKARCADLVAFGELHGHPVGAAFELALLQRLSSHRPVALAMEFFERDHQDAIKAYLRGSMDEEAFREATKRTKAYDDTHAPLVEWQKARKAYVIAANSPRRLVSGYRKSGLTYPEYLASLSAEDRALLPKETTVLEDAYWERFSSIMPGNMAKPFFKAQSLWDDAMAESMARFRSSNLGHQVLFVVGGFHVTDGLGTITKYHRRRPTDRVAILLMDGVMEGQGDLELEDEDKGTGDAVLKVFLPKPKRRPSPHDAPKKPKAEETDGEEKATDAPSDDAAEETPAT